MAAIIPYLPALISAAASIGGGLLSKGPKETPIQGQQRELIDQILASIKGEGPFSSLFNADEDTFQKSFVEPAKQMFKGQIAPQIQQGFIQSGQQRGTGLEDTLTRAGVDMDQMLNQQYMQFQQGAQNRMANAFGSILGAGPGVQSPLGFGEKLGQSVQGWASQGLPSSIDAILKGFSQQRNQPANPLQPESNQPLKRGFE